MTVACLRIEGGSNFVAFRDVARAFQGLLEGGKF